MTRDEGGAVEYLCSTSVADETGWLHLWATPKIVVLDRVRPKKGRDSGGSDRVREIPIANVASIEVEAISDARHEYGWKPTTGFLNKGTQVRAVTGVLMVLVDGEHVLWRVPGKAPIEVKAELGRLIAQVGS